MVEVGESLGRRVAALEQHSRERQTHIRLDLGGGGCDRVLKADKDAQALLQRRVVAGEIGVGIKAFDIKGRISEWRLGRFCPEEVAIDAREETVALQALALLQA